jgi:hypothetical protein
VPVGVAVGVPVGMLVVPVTVGECEVGEAVSGRHWASVTGVPNSPAGQRHAELPLTVRMVRPPVQPEVQTGKEGTPHMVLVLPPQKSLQAVTLPTLQAVRLPLKAVA